jgi:hypothetical protein
MVLMGFEKFAYNGSYTLKSLKRHLEGLGDGTVTTILFGGILSVFVLLSDYGRRNTKARPPEIIFRRILSTAD